MMNFSGLLKSIFLYYFSLTVSLLVFQTSLTTASTTSYISGPVAPPHFSLRA